jgi:hypothetical protein
MNQSLFALGLFVVGFTLLYLMPASFHKNWKELGAKPPGGDSVVFMLRIMGALITLAAFIIASGAVDLTPYMPPPEPS